jgi:hypothetical protein
MNSYTWNNHHTIITHTTASYELHRSLQHSVAS